jgi:hypothetical protein
VTIGAYPAFISINREGFYIAGPKDLEDGIFDDLHFPEEALAQAALLGDYAEQVYGTDEKFYDAEIGKAVKQDFVNWLTDLLESGFPVDVGKNFANLKALECPDRFWPLFKPGAGAYIDLMGSGSFTGDEEVGYKDRRGLHLTGMKLADLINDHLHEDHLIQAIEQSIDGDDDIFEDEPHGRKGLCYALHFLHFTDGLSALNACANLQSTQAVLRILTEEMNLSKKSLGISKYTDLTGCTIGLDGRNASDVRDYCSYPALVSIGRDAVFVTCDEDFDAASDVLRSNADMDEMRKVFGPECEDRTYGDRYEEELDERIEEYLDNAREALSHALGFAGEKRGGKPNGELVDIEGHSINRALNIPEEYDAALPIMGLWQPDKIALTYSTRLYLQSEGKGEWRIRLEGLIALYLSDEEIVKAVENFRNAHGDIPMREKFTSVTSDLYSGIDALNMLALLYGSREVATLALVDAAAKRGITIIGVEFR